MPRARREVVPDFPHHIVLRGNNRRRIFSYPYDRIAFLRLLRDAQVKTDVAVHAVCLLSNHVHLLATPSADDRLAMFVKSFAQRYAQQRNKRRRASGKLFEQRFWSRPVKARDYIAVATAYIDDNARQAGLSEGVGARWSSVGLHTGAGGAHPCLSRVWSPSTWYLSLGTSASARSSAYSDWLTRYQAHSDWAAFYKDVPSRCEIGGGRRPDSSKVT